MISGSAPIPNTLKNRRPEPTLIPEVLPIYKVISQQFRLEEAIPTKIAPTPSNGYAVKGTFTTDKYLYQYFTFRAHGMELKLMVNPRTQVAENLWFTPGIDPVTLGTLLRVAFDSLRPNLFYMECYVSAFAPEIQRVFVDCGFQATGYIPGWNMVDGKREDTIIFSWVKDFPLLSSLKLTRRATKIAKVFLS